MSEYGLRQQDYETIKALKQEVADLRARLEKAEKDATSYKLFGYYDDSDGIFSLPGFYSNEESLIERKLIAPVYIKT